MTPDEPEDDAPDPRHITGQVFVRETGAITLDGRRLVQFAGVIALDQRALEGEHQYVVLGRVDADNGIVRLSILPESAANDRTELARGKGMDAMLAEPIWIT
jgi:hypothetical protein